MKIDKANETLELMIRGEIYILPPDFKDAGKLGIEALKAYQKGQEAGWYPPGYKLPGETDE